MVDVDACSWLFPVESSAAVVVSRDNVTAKDEVLLTLNLVNPDVPESSGGFVPVPDDSPELDLESVTGSASLVMSASVFIL